MALPKYIDEYTQPKSEPRSEGERYSDYEYSGYKPFNQEQKKDFYDLMTPKWSEQMAKQYNKDMQEGPMINGPIQIKSLKSDPINPAHYQGIVGNYQYIECMEFILGYDGLKAHLIGQIYKYMMRLGKKDSEQQELGKVIWYSRCLAILLRDGTIIGKLKELE